MEDDLKGNGESMEDRDDEIRYECDSKYSYIYIFLFLTMNEMKSGIKMIGWRDEKDKSAFLRR